MPTIAEILNKYKPIGLGNVFHEDWLNKSHMLANDLKKLVKIYPAIKFCLMYFDITGKFIDYDSVVGFFRRYNVITLDDFIKFDNALKIVNINNIIEDIGDGKKINIDLDRLRKIDVRLLLELIKELIPEDYIEKDCHYNIGDGYYYIPTYDIVKDILEFSNVNMLKYIKAGRDCEDFSTLLKCYLRKYGYGNLTLANIGVNLYRKNGGVFNAHGLNLVIYLDNNGNYNIKLIEPQNDMLINFGEIVCCTKYYKIKSITI